MSTVGFGVAAAGIALTDAASDSDSSSPTLGHGAIVFIAFALVALIAFLVITFAVLRCYSIRRIASQDKHRVWVKRARSFRSPDDDTPRIRLITEMPEDRLLEAQGPPSYHEAISTENSPALPHHPDWSRSPSSSPFLYPQSPAMRPYTPSSPMPAAASPLLGSRHY